MKLLLLILLIPSLAFARPLCIAWDAPTNMTDGSPITKQLTYNIYRKIPPADWKQITHTILTHYCQQVIFWGHTVYEVRATCNNCSESDPSNELKIFVDLVGAEEP